MKTFSSFIKNAFFNNRALAKNSAVLFCGIMGASVLNYIFHLVIGRIVSIEDYGKIESLLSLTNIILIPTLTISMITTKISAGFKAKNDKAGSRFFVKYLNKKIFWYGLPVLAVFLLLTPFISRFLKIGEQWPLILIWILMFISFFSSVNSGALGGWQRFKDVSALNIWGALVKLIGGILLVKLGFGINGAIGSVTLGTIAAYIASEIALKFISAGEDGKAGLPKILNFEMRSFILPFFVGNLAINMLGNADMVLAKHILNATEAGQYGALTIVSKIIFYATGVIATVLFSMSAENHHKKTDTSEIFRNSSYLMLAISLAAIVFYFLFPGFMLRMLFGSKYADVSQYLGWFAIMVALFSYVNLMFQYLLSIHKTKIVYSLFTIALASSLIILFTGHDIYGIIKIAIISQMAGIAVGIFYLYEKNKK